MADVLTLEIGGRQYGGWTAATVTRGLCRCVSNFQLNVSERWTGQPTPWPIVPFAPARILLGADAVLTGYVDEYSPAFGPGQHSVSIAGRSATCDLVDCKPDMPSGQYAGFTLAAIARGIGALFKPAIAVVVADPAANQVVPEANIERCETAWNFLERLCRLVGVLAMDDGQGRLVLTRAGNVAAVGRLVQGQNILHASARLSGAKRFSQYVLKGQMGLGVAAAGGSAPASLSSSGGAVQTQMRVTATDPGVPRYRPYVTLCESQLSLAQMQERVDWQAAHAYGRSISAEITVQGWRQPDATLWQPNQLVTVVSSFLGVAASLLITEVEWTLSESGRQTRLKVAPIQGFTPKPKNVHLQKKQGGGGGGNGSASGVEWAGAGGK